MKPSRPIWVEISIPDGCSGCQPPIRGGVISAFARHRNFGKDQNMVKKRKLVKGVIKGATAVGTFGGSLVVEKAAKTVANKIQSSRDDRLEPYEFTQEVVGEINYQPALEKIVGRERDDEGSYWQGEAEISHDKGNKHDKSAIVVKIDNKTVGYLPSSPINAELVKVFKKKSLKVPAQIIGGFKFDPDDQRAQGRKYGHLGVELALEINDMR